MIFRCAAFAIALLALGVWAPVGGSAEPDPVVDGLPRLVWRPVFQPLEAPGLDSVFRDTLVVDSSGFLWLGGLDGLIRYDGQRRRIVSGTPDDPQLFVGTIRAMVADAVEPDVLWVATEDAVTRYDLRRERFDVFRSDAATPGPPAGSIRALVSDPRGRLWIGTLQGALVRYDPAHRAWRTFDSDDGFDASTVVALSVGRSGQVYVGGARQVYEILADDRVALFERPGPSIGVRSVHEAPDGTVWIGTIQGLARLDRATQSFDLVHAAPPGKDKPGVVFEIVDAENGALWIGWSDHGPVLFDPATGSMQTVAGHEEPEFSVHGLTREPRGVVWLQNTVSTEYTRFDPAGQAYRFFEPEFPGSPSVHQIMGLCGDLDERFYMGTDKGLLEIEAETGNVLAWHRPETDLPALVVSSCHFDAQGTLWVGTFDGLFRRRAGDDRFELLEHDGERAGALAHKVVAFVEQAADGSLWVGTFAELHRYDSVGDRFERFRWELEGTTFDSLTPHRMLVDRGGQVWFTTLLGGLYTIEPGGEAIRFVPYHPDEPDISSSLKIYDLAQQGNVLWLATDGGGLRKLDASRRLVAEYDLEQGLANVVGNLQIDRDGMLWLWTDRGLLRFDPDSESVLGFEIDRATKGSHFSSTYLLPTGRIVRTHVQRMAVFDPDEMVARRTERRPPRIAVSGLRFAQEAVPIGDEAPIDRAVHQASHVDLGYRDDIVSFELATFDFDAPSSHRISYRLRGFDERWIVTPPDWAVATYTDLDPGQYVFEARAAHADGPWSEPTALAVVVAPPPWRTGWAYAGYLLGALGLAFATWRGHRRKLERERRVNRQLRELDRLKDDFLANTSHELRTPLFGISGLAESALAGRHGSLNAPLRDDLELIVSSARRLSTLVNDILDFSKSRHQGIELRRRPVDLRALVDVVLTLIRPLVADKELELENRIDAGFEPVEIDRDRIQQVLHNLIGNAIKFTAAGSVTVDADRRDDAVYVSVRDTGAGVPKPLQAAIFRAFEQGSPSVEREHGGTGLGLAVSRQIVERHGGSMWVESEPGAGATFYFSLPRRPAAAPAAVADSGSERAVVPSAVRRAVEVTVEAESAAETVAGQAMISGGVTGRILVVDDDAVNRRVLVGYLEDLGHDVLQAADGPCALEILTSEPADRSPVDSSPHESAPRDATDSDPATGDDAERIDLVLLDIMMPKMSGYEVCRAIRRRWSREDLPVLFLTAKSQVADRVAGFAQGANDYLLKPVARGELMARVAKELELLALHRQLAGEVRSLSGLLPICASCKSVRDDDGYWSQIETYISQRSEAQFSHGICPDCLHRLYGDLDETVTPSETSTEP
ncbi:MAG: ATP-binding protein [Acidobacteriota bacterium]